jgi:hypothetical protein
MPGTIGLYHCLLLINTQLQLGAGRQATFGTVSTVSVVREFVNAKVAAISVFALAQTKRGVGSVFKFRVQALACGSGAGYSGQAKA